MLALITEKDMRQKRLLINDALRCSISGAFDQTVIRWYSIESKNKCVFLYLLCLTEFQQLVNSVVNYGSEHRVDAFIAIRSAFGIGNYEQI